MSLDTFQGILDNVADIQHIQMQGEGEPLLNPNLFVMMRMVRDRFPLAIISMYTNGSLFTKKVIEHMIAVRIDSIYISLESADPKEFHRIRGGNLPRVIEGIQALMKYSRPLRPEVGLAVTILKETIPQIVPITELYTKLNLDGGISAQPLSSMDSYTPVYSSDMISQLLTHDDGEAWRKLIHENPQAKAVMEIEPTVPSFHSHLSKVNDPDPTPSVTDNFGCPWLNIGSYITTNGTACACCFIKDITLGFSTFNQENVHTNRKILQAHLKEGIIPEQCKNCNIAERVSKEAKDF
jgi:MoaA/NifB/PqqE/SkfB family radical SAM enzyme